MLNISFRVNTLTIISLFLGCGGSDTPSLDASADSGFDASTVIDTHFEATPDQTRADTPRLPDSSTFDLARMPPDLISSDSQTYTDTNPDSIVPVDLVQADASVINPDSHPDVPQTADTLPAHFEATPDQARADTPRLPDSSTFDLAWMAPDLISSDPQTYTDANLDSIVPVDLVQADASVINPDSHSDVPHTADTLPALDGIANSDTIDLTCPPLIRPAPSSEASIVPAQQCGDLMMASVGAALSDATNTMVRGTTLGYVKFFSLSDEKPNKVFKAHTGFSRVTVAISNDGTVLATGGTTSVGTREIKIWKLPELSLTATIPSDRNNLLHFSRDGKLLGASAAGGIATIVDIYKTSDGTLEMPAISLGRAVNDFDISPDNTLLAIGTFRGDTSIWNMPTGTLRTTLDVATTYAIEFSPDGTKLACEADGGFYYWNVNDWTLVFPMIFPFGTELAVSPDNSKIAVGNSIIDAATGAILKKITLPSSPTLFQFRTNSELMVSYSMSSYSRGPIDRYDIPSGTVISSKWDAQDIIGQSQFSQNDQWLVSPTRTTKFCIGDPSISTFAGRDSIVIATSGELAIAPLSAEISGVDILRTSDFLTQSSLSDLESALVYPTLSPNGDRLIMKGPLVPPSTSLYGLSIWSVAMNQSIREIIDPFGYSAPIFSPDGSQIAALNGNHGNGSYPIRILDATLGTIIGTLSNDIQNPNFQFSTDGKYLVVSGSTSAVSWDLTAMTSTILPTAFSPTAISSKGTIATAGPSNSILFWSGDGKTTQGSLTLPDKTGLTTLTFNKEGTVLASSHKDGSTWFWCP